MDTVDRAVGMPRHVTDLLQAWSTEVVYRTHEAQVMFLTERVIGC